MSSFFSHAPAPAEVYTLSLHDALPIYTHVAAMVQPVKDFIETVTVAHELGQFGVLGIVSKPVDFIQGDVVGGHTGGHVQHSATANCGQLCPVTDHGHIRVVQVGQL